MYNERKIEKELFYMNMHDLYEKDSCKIEYSNGTEEFSFKTSDHEEGFFLLLKKFLLFIFWMHNSFLSICSFILHDKTKYDNKYLFSRIEFKLHKCYNNLGFRRILWTGFFMLWAFYA